MSWIFAAFVLLLAGLMAWSTTHFGRKAGQPERKLRGLRWLFLVGGLAAATFVYFTDAEQRGTTLFEVVLEGTQGATPNGRDMRPSHKLTFRVEHPGVEHQLTLAPKPGFGAEASKAVTIAFSLDGPNKTYVSKIQEFARIRQTSNSRGVPVVRMVWQSESWRFTPTEAGDHKLEIAPYGEIPQILVRITDPDKTDGTRASGY